MRFEGLDDEPLKAVPVVGAGERLQEGSTDVDLPASRLAGRSARVGNRRDRPGPPVEDAVEEKRERALRLCAKRHVGSEQRHAARADSGVRHGNRAAQARLTPRPSAPQW